MRSRDIHTSGFHLALAPQDAIRRYGVLLSPPAGEFAADGLDCLFHAYYEQRRALADDAAEGVLQPRLAPHLLRRLPASMQPARDGDAAPLGTATAMPRRRRLAQRLAVLAHMLDACQYRHVMAGDMAQAPRWPTAG